jgi:hypothetical protein
MTSEVIPNNSAKDRQDRGTKFDGTSEHRVYFRMRKTPPKAKRKTASGASQTLSPSVQRLLLSKGELAAALSLSERQIEKYAALRTIPRLRLSPRLIRYSPVAVMSALLRFQIPVKEAA